jgi:hypothetical protein
MTNISEARALITGSFSRTRKSGQNGDFTVVGKVSPQDCGWEEFCVHLIGKYTRNDHLVVQPKGQNVMIFPSISASARRADWCVKTDP